MDSLIGKTIVRYKISTLLGEGGMGSVYKARDITLQRDVAIKIMHAQYSRQAAFQERFLQEARTAARFRNPNIVQVFDFGQAEDQLYIVMEFIPGDNLGVMLQKLRQKGKWLLLPEAVKLVEQICLAIDYAHQNGVLHRDIKPNNIMIDPEPGGGLPYHPVITDLGLAKLAEGGVMTQEGSSMGTPAYMSPEQALGQKTDNRSDVYSLGILAYELTVGKLPFPATNLAQAIQYHTKTPVPSPQSVRSGFPAGLEKIILKALEKDAAQRYQSAADFAAALANSSQAPTQIVTETEKSESVSLITVHQDASANARGDSVLNEFEPLPESALDRIQIMAPEQTSVFVSIKKKTLTLGRVQDNDIVLTDLKASRHHARIEVEGSSYKVYDLDSSNGTLLGSVKLLPGVPEVWTPDKALKIGDTYLKLVLHGQDSPQTSANQMSVPIAKPAARAGSKTQFDPGSFLSSPGQGRVGALMENTAMSVQPGQSVTASIVLLNQGALVDHFMVSAQGLPDKINVSPTPVVQLLPGDQKTASFNITPPRSASVKAGTYPFIIRVNSQSVPDKFVEVKATLTISPYYQFNSELRPQKITSPNPARISVTNLGNSPDTFKVDFSDRGEELSFYPPQLQIQVPEGQTVTSEFRIIPKQPKWMGSAPTFGFNLKVTSSNNETQSHSGEFVSKARLPVWLIPAMLVLCLCIGITGIGAAALNGAFTPISNPTFDPGQTVLLTDIPTEPTLEATPTLFSITEQPGSSQPTDLPTETTSPTADIPATVAPKAIVAQFVHPSPGEFDPETRTKLRIQVSAFDPNVGSSDGDGIQSVDFHIINQFNDEVYNKTENNAAYCAFGGGDADNPACIVLEFYREGNRWPNGIQITPGTYTIRAVVYAISGATQQVETQVNLNPFGRIAYISDETGNQEIFVMNEDGSNAEPVTNDPGLNHPWFAWSHNGRRLAFIAGSVLNNGDTGENDIYIVNADGTGLINVTNQPFSHLQVSWSPDDTMLLFSSNQENSNRDIYVINADGGNLRNLTNDPAYDTQPFWSPDGNLILFRSDRSGSDEFYLINPDGSNLRQLTFNFINTVHSGGFSPNGDKIVFSMQISNEQIYTINIDGSNQVNLTNNLLNCSNPEWSPEGNRILYTCFDPGGSGINDLFVMKATGLEQIQITSGVDVYNPQWSPDGLGYLFYTNRDGNNEIYLLDLNGNNWTRLTNNTVSDFNAYFMP